MRDFIDKWVKAIEQGKTVALLRLPYQNDFQALILERSSKTSLQNNVEPRFTICPFSGENISEYNTLDKLTLGFDDLSDLIISTPLPKHMYLESKKNFGTKEFESQVEHAIERIKKGELEKVVLARNSFHDGGKPDWNRLQSLFQDSSAFTYLIHDPNFGFWFGASPELLVSRLDQKVKCMALAGTRSNQEPWGVKEIREQEIVSETVENLMTQSLFTHIEKTKVYTRNAGPLEHLCSEVEGMIPENMSLKDFVQKLHPTPALGGYPREKALECIQNIERFDRQLYGGYIGISHPAEEFYFVNIRCFRWYSNGVLQFAGAGINNGSEPQKEFTETQNKMEVLGKYILNSQS